MQLPTCFVMPDVPGFKILQVYLQPGETIICSTEPARLDDACPKCGSAHNSTCGTRQIHLRDLPLYGKPVTIVHELRRLRCDNCRHRHIQKTELRSGWRNVTARMQKELIRMRENRTSLHKISRNMLIPVSTLSGQFRDLRL